MKIKSILVLISALLTTSAPALAVSTTDSDVTGSDSIWLPGSSGLHRWRAIGRDELIVWSSPSRPYLVKIWRPFSSLRFANVIGLTSTAGRVTKFDRVIVNGQRLPIHSITALDRDVAKNLHWQK